MGSDFICGDVTVSYDYKKWNEARFVISAACFKYFTELIARSSIDATKRDDITLQYHYEIIDMLESYKDKKPKSIIDYIAAFENYELFNTFIYFRMIGLYRLLAKSDCEGFYSPGDCLDIYIMLTNIQPYVTDDIKFPTLLKLFKNSFDIQENVLIC